jgi:hypothetical protein
MVRTDAMLKARAAVDHIAYQGLAAKVGRETPQGIRFAELSVKSAVLCKSMTPVLVDASVRFANDEIQNAPTLDWVALCADPEPPRLRVDASPASEAPEVAHESEPLSEGQQTPARATS